MLFFHGTKPENWERIQAEGVLWGWPCPRCYPETRGCKKPQSRNACRYTYLTPDLAVAKTYGSIILEVEYDPIGAGTGIDNYGFDPPPGQYCWQFSVFKPIPLSQVKIYELGLKCTR